MRFLCLYKPSKPEGTPPTQEEITRITKLCEDGFRSGRLLATEGCMPSALGARVRLAGGKFSVTDGPFAETKELIGGFALIQANSREEAIQYTKEFLQAAGSGETEIRRVFEAGECPSHSLSSPAAGREMEPAVNG